VPTEPEQIVDLPMHCKKPLRAAVGRKSAHLPFLLTRMSHAILRLGCLRIRLY